MYHRCYQDAIVAVINDRQGDLRILIDLAYLQWQRAEFSGLLVFSRMCYANPVLISLIPKKNATIAKFAISK